MLLISDANVLIDMIAGELLEAMFQLQEEFAVPDTLFDEELAARHPELPEQGLMLMTVEPEGVMEAAQLVPQFDGRKAPGIADLLALMLAKQEHCPLVTGDRRLREFAAEDYPDIEIRGTLWLVGQLVITEVITVDEAEGAYEKMINQGSRLPQADIRKQLKQLRSQPV